MTKKLTRFQRDTLKEVASIGANAASISLSKLIGKLILVELTKLSLMPINRLTKKYNKKEDIGILFSISGDIGGAMITIASEHSMLLLSDMIQKRKIGYAKKLDEENKDLIKEVANILVGSYLAALSSMTKLNMLESTPGLLINTFDNILKTAVKKLKGPVEDVVVIENILIIEKREFKQEIMLILMPEELDRLFNILFKELK